jgi:hypothetical protein
VGKVPSFTALFAKFTLLQLNKFPILPPIPAEPIPDFFTVWKYFTWSVYQDPEKNTRKKENTGSYSRFGKI